MIVLMNGLLGNHEVMGYLREEVTVVIVVVIELREDP